MSSPTPNSVTNVPCLCGYLERSAREPNFPVKFDSECNEYFFEHQLPSGTMLSISLYHCPMCGGVASESKRDELFVRLSDEEALRIDELMQGASTLEDIQRLLGPPDSDEVLHPPADVRIVQPGTSNIEAGALRVLEYNRLSESGDVQFTIYSNGKIVRFISPKHKKQKRK